MVDGKGNLSVVVDDFTVTGADSVLLRSQSSFVNKFLSRISHVFFNALIFCWAF